MKRVTNLMWSPFFNSYICAKEFINYDQFPTYYHLY